MFFMNYILLAFIIVNNVHYSSQSESLEKPDNDLKNKTNHSENLTHLNPEIEVDDYDIFTNESLITSKEIELGPNIKSLNITVIQMLGNQEELASEIEYTNITKINEKNKTDVKSTNKKILRNLSHKAQREKEKKLKAEFRNKVHQAHERRLQFIKSYLTSKYHPHLAVPYVYKELQRIKNSWVILNANRKMIIQLDKRKYKSVREDVLKCFRNLRDKVPSLGIMWKDDTNILAIDVVKGT